MICSKEMEEYFNSLKNNAEKCYSIARDARKKNLDEEYRTAKNKINSLEGLIL